MNALYQQVCNRILQQIVSGERKVGDRLAPESVFAQEIGVSRSTVRMAFNELESVGVIRRRKRAGTEIIAAAPQPKFKLSTSSINELLNGGDDSEFVLESITTVHSSAVSSLHDQHSEPGFWLEVSGVRVMNNNDATPFGVIQSYVPACFAGIEPQLQSNGFSVFQAIEQVYNVSLSRVTQSTNFAWCSEKDARTLGLEVGEPLLQVDSMLYVDKDTVIQQSVARYDPARFSVSSDVTIE